MFLCLNCEKENTVKRTTKNRFCDNKCQADYYFKTVILPKAENGEITTRRTLHKVLKHRTGYCCNECDNTGTYNGKALALQLDHIDGNAGNNRLDNLRLLCPNCHSQTATYVAKNKGNGRGSRGIKR